MNAWPKVAWNMLDDDDPESWKSRYALEGCVKDIPVICPFTPLSGISICVVMLTSMRWLRKGIWIVS